MGVLEALVARVLGERLGEWVEGISPEALNIGWRGDAQLSNLQLRAGSIVPGKLPLVVHSGRIGRLIVQVPWADLSQPTIIQLHEFDATLAIADAAQALRAAAVILMQVDHLKRMMSSTYNNKH
ncbi:N-terminal region of Chorein, a TM vesicle-mediated sorter-domain-containing protein [Pavlovales sp. CCMP2436]|nr:N-terminal region of Chorein, a TM vesicle-mediated sorter-domain-containing protein [Pavlovales sp. CCMP2436]